jgi:DNA-binding NtrC family response regulator
VEHFIELFGKNEGITGITEEALAALKSYHWPRNIRQLKNAVRQAVVMHDRRGADAHLIRIGDLPQWVLEGPPAERASSGTRKAITKALLERVLHENGWNVPAAARHFGCSEGHAYYLIRKFGLQKPGSDGA